MNGISKLILKMHTYFFTKFYTCNKEIFLVHINNIFLFYFIILMHLTARNNNAIFFLHSCICFTSKAVSNYIQL